MKSLLRSSLFIGAMAGAAVSAPAVATAGVSIGIGVPAVVVGVSPGYVAYDEEYYYDPIYISGAWYHGPYRWRMWHGKRMFFVDGRWHSNEWREGRVPESIVFRNGGSFRDGRYNGFDGAERINARFHVNAHDMREDRRELNQDKSDMQHDRNDMRQDREDRNDARHENGNGDRHNGGDTH
jgi:hypothetical protein